ncbi:hypothetical protein Mpal_1393 [Methanosphaerula palustris E1-9c]|uniref:Uncharacterized protein n=1 Tax=Methanosphaerula palustris (strain ATCC BAA-1556 / DSM 19958 / E1-9c) TaxID=521011 RepID=B8GHY3_METPE|nr:hypothetical protein Mpal_1393 [Methanosphaerula palustris E1-9c]
MSRPPTPATKRLDFVNIQSHTTGPFDDNVDSRIDFADVV